MRHAAGALCLFVAACGGDAFTTDGTGQGGASSAGGNENDATAIGAGGMDADATTTGAGGQGRDASGNGGGGGTAGNATGGAAGEAAAGSGGMTIGDDGAIDSASSDGAVDSASSDGAAADGQACTIFADEAMGIMVVPSAGAPPTDVAVSCGTKAGPCTSVQAAIDTAVATAKSFVYLAAGTYNEDDIALARGISLTGGWAPDWSRRCVSPPQATIIRNVTGTKVVSAIDLGGKAALEALTLKSKPQASVGISSSGAGESLYGVFAAGSTTAIDLLNVRIELGSGGRGKDGDGAIDATPAAAAGSCPSPNSTPAAQPGASGIDGSGATSGGFSVDGYDPNAGQDGAIGTTGGDGVTTPPSRGICTTCTINSTSDGCNNAATEGVGGPATAGCGGNPGGAGLGGSGGGSTVAVFAADARVVISAGQLIVGDGGDGGNGSAGKVGGDGSVGVAGQATTCFGSCCFGTAATCRGAVAAQAASSSGAGGSNAPAAVLGVGGIICISCQNSCFGAGAHSIAGGDGTTGAVGGQGGTGGGGAGGMAYAVVKVGTGTVMLGDGTVFVHGQEGLGGTGVNRGSDGTAGDEL
jgi:hypothetical protein